jgi:septal ring-binding cell division protein DamX
MFGQPELDRKLQNKAIRQLRERITHSFNLDPLSEDEIREYLHFRLQTAGCPWPQLFSPNAEKLLAKASGGLTRRINILADKALLAAYADPSVRQDARNSAGEILPMVLPRHVKIALADSGYQRFKLPALPAWVVYGTTGLALLVLLYFGLQQAGVLRPPETSPGDAVALVTERSGVVERAAQPVVEPMAPPTSPSAESVAAAPDLVEEAEPQAAVEPAAASSAMAVGEAPPAPTPEAAPPEVAATSTLVDEPVLIADPEPEPAPDSTVDVPQAAAAAAPASAPAVPPAAVVDTPPAAASVEEADDIVPPGLAGQRHGPSLAWLNSLTQKDGYTIQMYSISTRQPDRLEEFLEFLELTGLLDNSYICVISGNTRRQEQWLVMHGEFAGLSDARRFIRELPPYLRQYQPYARNLDDIACAE